MDVEVTKEVTVKLDKEDVRMLQGLFYTYERLANKLPDGSYTSHLNYIERFRMELRDEGWDI